MTNEGPLSYRLTIAGLWLGVMAYVAVALFVVDALTPSDFTTPPAATDTVRSQAPGARP